MGTTPKNKAIDAEYLLSQLKNFDKNILENKYITDISLVDDTTGTKYTLGINNGVLYIKEVTG